EDRRQIHASPAQLDEAIVLAVDSRFDTFDILNVQKQQSIVVTVDGLSRIAATLNIVGNVQLQFYVTRIRRIQNPVHLFRLLAQAAHMVVIAHGNAQVRGAFADSSEKVAKFLVVVWNDRAVLRTLVS